MGIFQWGIWIEKHPRNKKGYLYILDSALLPEVRAEGHKYKVFFDRGGPDPNGIHEFPLKMLGRMLIGKLKFDVSSGDLWFQLARTERELGLTKLR